jgi:hypothetical protein
MPTGLVQQYAITEQSMQLRREFIKLTNADIRALRRVHGWAHRIAPTIAREFYDHQFAFGPTMAIFNGYAVQKNLSIEAVRNHLETTQAGYFTQIFDEALEGDFGTGYFEHRLKVGRVHNIINLPPKWYLGSYTLYADLFHKHLVRHFAATPCTRVKLRCKNYSASLEISKP